MTGRRKAAAAAPSRTADDISGLARLVESAPYAVLLISMEQRSIIAASAAARALADGAELVGRPWDGLLADPATGGLELVQHGRLTGYEAMRKLNRPGHHPQPVQMWVRAVEPEAPVDHALILLATEGQLRVDAAASPLDPSHAQVIGAAGRDLVIDRVSADVEKLTGLAPETVLHRSLLSLVVDADAGTLLVALGQVATSGRGASAAVRVRTAGGDARPCDCVLVPLQPPPSVAFALISSDQPDATVDGGMAADELIARFRMSVIGAQTSRNLRTACPHGLDLAGLTTRELVIVNRLLDGDRVPAIARDMFLSQSTVRSHLSSLFGKFGVSSQQELITLLRDQPRRSV